MDVWLWWSTRANRNAYATGCVMTPAGHALDNARALWVTGGCDVIRISSYAGKTVEWEWHRPRRSRVVRRAA
jgi:hypothetical protein